MSIDPFHPDDAGDYSAIYEGRHTRGRRRGLGARIAVTVAALVLVAAAAVVAVAVV